MDRNVSLVVVRYFSPTVGIEVLGVEWTGKDDSAAREVDMVGRNSTASTGEGPS